MRRGPRPLVEPIDRGGLAREPPSDYGPSSARVGRVFYRDEG